MALGVMSPKHLLLLICLYTVGGKLRIRDALQWVVHSVEWVMITAVHSAVCDSRCYMCRHCAGKGKATQEISEQLSIKEKLIKWHLS